MSTSMQRTIGYGTAIASETLSVDSTTAAQLTVPGSGKDRAKSCLVSARAEDARWRVDGPNPTSTVGHPLVVDNFIELYGDDMTNASFISQSGTNTVLFVTYFK